MLGLDTAITGTCLMVSGCSPVHSTEKGKINKKQTQNSPSLELQAKGMVVVFIK